MVQKLERIEHWFRIIAIAVLVGLVVVGVIQLYDYYHNRVGATSERAVYAWVQALADGDTDALYQMTARDRLTDIYGRPLTETEFRRQIRAVTGDEPLPLRLARAPVLLTDDRNVAYYRLELTSSDSSASGTSRVLLEVSKQGGAWLVTWPFAIVL